MRWGCERILAASHCARRVSECVPASGIILMAAFCGGSPAISVRKTLLWSEPPNQRRSVNLRSMARPTLSLPRKGAFTAKLILSVRAEPRRKIQTEADPGNRGTYQAVVLGYSIYATFLVRG